MARALTRILNPKVKTPLFATNANPLQLYHSPTAWPLSNSSDKHLALLPSWCKRVKNSTYDLKQMAVWMEGR